MKQSKFNELSKELQKEFLIRGGKVEPDNPAPINPYMTWNYKLMYGKNKNPNKKKKSRRKK